MNVTLYNPVTSALFIDGWILPVLVLVISVPLLTVLFDKALNLVLKTKDTGYVSVTFAGIVGLMLFVHFMPQ